MKYATTIMFHIKDQQHLFTYKHTQIYMHICVCMYMHMYIQLNCLHAQMSLNLFLKILLRQVHS